MKKAMPQRAERVVSIDIIRGFALLGIFFVNVPMMQKVLLFGTMDGIDGGIRLFYDLFVQTKFYVIFSFLFGVSAYYFMRSQEKKGLAHKQLFIKRVIWLLVFGVIHLIFIWFGDILHNYALIGLVLPLFYKLSPKKIMVTAGIMLILSTAITQLPALFPSDTDIPYEKVENIQAPEEVETVKKMEPSEDGIHWKGMESNESYLDEVQRRAQQFVSSLPLFIINNLELLSLALFGLGLAKAKLFEEFPRYKKAAKKVAIIAFVLSLPFNALIIIDFMNGIPIGNHFYVWMSGKFLAPVYVIVFLFACEHAKFKQKLAPLGAFGKMAFTNYLCQSIITIYIVMPFIEDFTMTMQFIYCIVFLAIQVALSSILMKKFKYGPFEWLWRKLVFGWK